MNVRTLLLVGLATLALIPMHSAPSVSAEQLGDSTRSLVLPIPANETWYVCQGYNGKLTHEGMASIDLSLDPRSPGPKGCMKGTKFTSAGSVVSSPSAGTAYRWPGCCGDDFVCVNFDSGGSAAIGHLSNRVKNGTRVGTGSSIGTVAWPHRSNGDYAHIHVQIHMEHDCTEGSDPVPVDVTHGFNWLCTPNLPNSGEINQYSGLAVNRCRSSAKEKGQEPKQESGLSAEDVDAPQPGVGGRSRPSNWPARVVDGLIGIVLQLLPQV